MQRVKRMLEFEGYKVNIVNWAVNYNETVPALIVDTDYEGLYPTDETITAHANIRKIIARYKGRFRAESHSAKVCMYIFENKMEG